MDPNQFDRKMRQLEYFHNPSQVVDSFRWRQADVTRYGINFNELPLWQRRGTGLYWENHSKIGYNPILGQEVVATRRQIKIDEALPMKEAYSEFVARLLESREKLKDNYL